MSTPLIQTQDVWFAYQHENVLEGISFDIAPNDFVAMIGPNGGGKTTLLKLMLGLLEPSRGTVRVFGQAPRQVSERVGYVPQHAAINPNFPISVLDVVLTGCQTPGIKWPRPTPGQQRLALDALARMGAADLAERRVSDLSGGQRQRVFIARALVGAPRILFLDEPTAGIDAQGQHELYCLLEKLNADITIVMVSHDMLAISTRVKSVACVNRQLHYHPHPELTHEMMEMMYHHPPDQACPVELLAHGVPHRVLRRHDDDRSGKMKVNS
jgi:zinc transport system ATP-binding protein